MFDSYVLFLQASSKGIDAIGVEGEVFQKRAKVETLSTNEAETISDDTEDEQDRLQQLEMDIVEMYAFGFGLGQRPHLLIRNVCLLDFLLCIIDNELIYITCFYYHLIRLIQVIVLM